MLDRLVERRARSVTLVAAVVTHPRARGAPRAGCQRRNGNRIKQWAISMAEPYRREPSWLSD